MFPSRVVWYLVKHDITPIATSMEGGKDRSAIIQNKQRLRTQRSSTRTTPVTTTAANNNQNAASYNENRTAQNLSRPNRPAKHQHPGGGSPCKTQNASECNTDSRYKLRILGTLYAGPIAMGIVYVRTAVVNLQVSIVHVPL